MNCEPIVCVSNRAMMKASPRFFAVTTPSCDTVAELSLLVMKTARFVTSRSVPSAYFARTESFCDSPSPSSTPVGGKISSVTAAGTGPGSAGAPASSQRMRVA